MKFICSVFFLGFSAVQPSQLVSLGPTQSHSVALTFDAGADRGFASRILFALESNHVHATFGMTGLWAERNPDLIRRMNRDGDTFINHTYDHRSFTGFSAAPAAATTGQRVWEIRRTEEILHRLTGHSLKPYFRPPYGDYDASTLTLLRTIGYTYTVMWTVDSFGWRHLSAADILQRCISRLQPGAIYLMHVGSQSQDAFALPGLISALRRRHISMVTIPQLLRGH